MRPILLLGSACIWIASTALAQETPPPAENSVESEIREIRQLIEQQNRQLEALSRQFSALKDHMTGSGATQPGDKSPAAVSSPPATSPANVTASPTGAAAASPSTPAPAAANVPPTAGAAGKHTVAKGETLTSIAKRYNIPLADLEKANPIQNDRMLQIGQALTIPPTAAPAAAAAQSSPKPPEPPTQKKENP